MAQTFLINIKTQIPKQILELTFKRITNQIYKLLPMREQGKDWEKPLKTLIIELSGMERLFQEYNNLFFLILCKMEGLFTLTNEKDMGSYRNTIFECIGVLNEIKRNVLQE